MSSTYDPLFQSAPDATPPVEMAMRMHQVQYERANRLGADLADLNSRVKEALAYLGDALLWCEDRDMNVADCVSEAIAALKGDES